MAVTEEVEEMVRSVLASSRYFIAAAVLGAFVSSVVLIVSGVIAVANVAWHALRHPRTDVDEAKHMSVEFIELIDVFLLGTVLYITALGLYELFVDPELPMPRWLKIRDLDELKEKLIGVIIVLLAVTFLGSAVTWRGEARFLEYGAAIGIVIGMLALVLWVTGHHRRHQDHDGSG
jgi:uncharacterized membrane protein YqhA